MISGFKTTPISTHSTKDLREIFYKIDIWQAADYKVFVCTPQLVPNL